jgi:hypothetical protein
VQQQTRQYVYQRLPWCVFHTLEREYGPCPWEQRVRKCNNVNAEHEQLGSHARGVIIL